MNVPEAYRNLALVRQTALQFDSLKPAQVIARMKPLAIVGGPWFASAGEMTAIAYLNDNKPDLAGPLFAAIAKDKDAPASARSRAAQMAVALGIDVAPAQAAGSSDESRVGNACVSKGRSRWGAWHTKKNNN